MSHLILGAPIEFVAEPIKGSRFLAWLVPVDSAEAARAVLDEARRRWPDASHHCWAWRLTDGSYRSSDDGEPGGSAGRPILAQLSGREVHDLMAVVVRWFGGTRLGVGGLIRAYGGTCAQALDRAEIVERKRYAELTIRYGYDDVGAIQHIVQSAGWELLGTDWGDRVTTRVRLLEDALPAAHTTLRDRTAGRAELETEP